MSESPEEQVPEEEVSFFVDDATLKAPAGMSVLEALETAGIRLPHLCYHPALTPAANCRLCLVEVQVEAHQPAVRPACALKVKRGLTIYTDTPAVKEARDAAFHRLLQMAPNDENLMRMAAEFGVGTGPPADGCIRCRLCVRVCGEVVGQSALKTTRINKMMYVVPSGNECIGCGTCANICPTKAIWIEDADGVRTIRIRDEIIGRHVLQRCEACGARFATEKFLAHIEDSTHDHAHVKEEHTYCPTCAKLFSSRVASVRKTTYKPWFPR